MGNIAIAGSEVQSGGDIDITAFGGLTVTSLQEQHHREHKVEKKGPFADPEAKLWLLTDKERDHLSVAAGCFILNVQYIQRLGISVNISCDFPP